MAVNQETKIGLVVIGGIIIMAIAILSLGDLRFQKGYQLKVIFNDVSGLPDKAPVKSAGVEIGKVQSIDLVKDKAEVTVWLKEKIKIHRDAQVTIVSTGVIGTKYMNMTLGSMSQPVLEDGDTITGIDPISVDKMLSEGLKGFNELADAVKSFTGDKDLKTSLTDMLKNISDVSGSLKRVMNKEENNITTIIENFKDFSEKMKSITDNADVLLKGNKEDIQATIKNFRAVSEKLNTALDSINTIAKKIDSGEGTIGELISNKEMAEEVHKTIKSINEASETANTILKRVGGIETYWDYQANYNTKDELFRNDFGIQFRPRPDKFYYLGVNNIGEKVAGSSDYDSGDQRINSFTAKLGRDFGPFTVYGGLIRSTGGFGASYRPFNNKYFAINAEAFRFDRKVDGKSKAWVNAGGSIRVLEWLYVRANVEDVLERSTFNTSLNLVLKDEDLAYLLGLTGLSNLAK
jgi:phospholipid/cholesterol/gamma-HCH transport system substrate-binding protein